MTTQPLSAHPLRALLPEHRLRFDAEALAIWGTDRTTSFNVAPGCIAFPERVEEVQAIVRAARQHRLGLVPSGGRTGLSGGAVAGHGEVVLSLDRMNRILSFNPTDRLVTCQAGVITQVLQEYAEARGLCYPVDFASAGSSHIGGNIATNAGGIKVIRYGMTRDWVAGLSVVTGTGALLQLNGGLVKNNTGYDFRHLFIGSEGTLGVIVEAQLRLTTAPAEQSVLVMGLRTLADVLAALERLRAAVDLSAFEFFSELCLQKVIAQKAVRRPLSETAPFYALVEFDQSAEAQVFAVFEALCAQDVVLDGVLSQTRAQARSLWYLREAISESLAPEHPYKNDVSVCIEDVPEFLEDVSELVSGAYPQFEVCWYGHIGDGNLHLNILKPADLSDARFYEQCHAISPALFELVQARRGSVSAEHGVGLLKRDFLRYSRSDEEIEAMRGVKAVFDPDGIMNPGKLL